MRTRWVAVAIVGLFAVMALEGCGGDDPTGIGPKLPEFVDDRPGLVTPTPAPDAANRATRPGIDYNAPPPAIAQGVQDAARAAGCEVRGFSSEGSPREHISGDSATAQSDPPLSGAHNGRWADWGVYSRPIPYKYQLHNLEHGGVFVQYGTAVPVAAVNALREMWARSPAFLLISPNPGADFTDDAVVVGAQQRWMVCKPLTPGQVAAVRAFVTEYRGRGPEPEAGTVLSTLPRPSDLPEPVLPDTGAG